MSHKILIADDSSTIQKVIKITLANLDHEIMISENDSELLQKINESKPRLVLLDFNLSESKTGYELAKLIKDSSSNSRVLLMFGTFDTIDENLLRQSGASDKVIKPFDSARFAAICKSLLDEADMIEDSVDKDELEHLEIFTPDENDKMSSTDNLEDWEGMNIPNIIDNEDEHNVVLEDIPPKISEDEEEINLIDANEERDPILYPDEDDLDYPDVITEIKEPKSKLIPLEDLNFTSSDSSDDDTQLDIQIDYDDRSDEEMRKLEEIIEEDRSPEELWKVDEGSSTEISTEDKTISFELPQFVDDKMFNTDDQSVDIPIIEDKEIPAYNNEKSELDLDQKIKEAVESAVKKYCQDRIDKVVWEVIPELAENLIKKELSEITRSVIED